MSSDYTVVQAATYRVGRHGLRCPDYATKHEQSAWEQGHDDWRAANHLCPDCQNVLDANDRCPLCRSILKAEALEHR